MFQAVNNKHKNIQHQMAKNVTVSTKFVHKLNAKMANTFSECGLHFDAVTKEHLAYQE